MNMLAYLKGDGTEIVEKVFQYRRGNVWKQGFLFIHGFVYQITLGCIRRGTDILWMHHL